MDSVVVSADMKLHLHRGGKADSENTSESEIELCTYVFSMGKLFTQLGKSTFCCQEGLGPDVAQELDVCERDFRNKVAAYSTTASTRPLPHKKSADTNRSLRRHLSCVDADQ